MQPKCRFTPTCTAEVSEAVRLLEEYQCSFAIRGGGHTSWAEAANIGDNGLTIDLSALNDVAVAEPSAVAASGISNIVSVGGGARWLDVYKVLDSAGLGTAGGRVADVGVGGLTLGGKHRGESLVLRNKLSRVFRWKVFLPSSDWIRLRQCRQL